MSVTIDPFGWRQLTDVVNNLETSPSFLQKFFPAAPLWATPNIQVDVEVGGRKLAPIVKRDGKAANITKDGFKTQTFETPRIRQKASFTAQDLLGNRAAGMPVYNPTGALVANSKEAKIAAALRQMKDQVMRRLEWMAAGAFAGGFTYTGDDFEFTIDYQMPAANKPTLTSTAKWDAPTTALPLDNFRAWKRIVARATGLNASVAIMSYEAITYMLATTQVQTLIKLGGGLNIGDVRLDANPTAGLGSSYEATYIGTFAGVKCYQYDGAYVDSAGAEQPIIPVDKVILFAPDSNLRTHYGAIEDLDAGTIVAPFFSKDWTTKDPSALWLLTESSPLPVPHKPAGIVYADVY